MKEKEVLEGNVVIDEGRVILMTGKNRGYDCGALVRGSCAESRVRITIEVLGDVEDSTNDAR